MIRKSFDQLVDELDTRNTSTGGFDANPVGISVQLHESGGKCVWCKKKIKRKHQSWEWRFDEIIIRMHLGCFQYWFMSVVPDAEKAAALTGEERAQ